MQLARYSSISPRQAPKKRHAVGFILVSFLLSLLISGCTTVRLISPYDEIIDQKTSLLQEDTETLLLLLSNKTEQQNPVHLMPFSSDTLDELTVRTAVLKARSESTPKNDITTKMFELIESNLVILRSLIVLHDNNMPEANSPGDPLQRLDPDKIKLIRDNMRQGFQQIITLEIAKKRGDNS